MSHHKSYRSLMIAAGILSVVAVLFTGCIDLYTPSSAPGGISATQDEEDQIVITWNPVNRVSGYSVYRSLAEGGDYERIGSTAEISWIDLDVGPALTYWYSIASLPFDSSGLELRSSPVSGMSIHTFTWDRTTISNGAEYARIAADTSVEGIAYVAAAGTGESNVSVERFEDGTWSAFGDSVGAIDDTVADPGLFDIAADDDIVYVAYADRARGNAITVASRVNDEDAEWQTLGTAGFGDVPAGEINIAVVGGVVTVVSEVPNDPYVQAFEYSGDDWQALGTFGSAPAYAPTHVALLDDESSVVVVLEVPDPSLEPSPSTLAIYKYESGSGWSQVDSYPRIGNADDARNGAFSADSDQTGTTYFALIDEVEGLEVTAFSGTSWTDITPSVTADPNSSAVGIAAYSGSVYLFYRDATTLAGEVLIYDGSTWSPLPYSEDEPSITSDLSVTQLELDAYANRVFAAFSDGSGFAGDSVSAAVYR